MQLVDKFFRTHLGAIYHIQIDHADITDGRGQDAPLRVIQAIDIGHAIHGRFAAQDGNTVVGFLPGENTVIPGLKQGFCRKFVVGQLGFLDGQDVRPGQVTPGQQVRQAHTERIDIP